MAGMLLGLVAVNPSQAGAADEGVTGSGLSAEGFSELTTGRTLHFSHQGPPFGSEQYLHGGRTIWRFADGSCQSGDWWAERGLICFRYEGGPGQCWRFLPRPGGLAAELVEGADPGFVLDLSGSDTAPLDCAAPDLGV